MAENTTDFFESKFHALRAPEIVLRDSLGMLAIEIIKEKHANFSQLNYGTMLQELHEIIKDLHAEYHHQAF
jgi:hypothetical protein